MHLEFWKRKIYLIAESDKPDLDNSGPEFIKLFSCSAQLSMKIFLLINVEMPTFVGISIFTSRKNNILGLTEHDKMLNFLIFLYL